MPTDVPKFQNQIFRAQVPTDIEFALKNQFACFDKDFDYKIGQKGKFWVLYNYIKAKRWYACHESITYTTIGDLTFLDNLKTLAEHWQGPISLALYTPGTDFQVALSIILYLRQCESQLIAEYVTFHLYFETQHLPEEIPVPENFLEETINCQISSPLSFINGSLLYRSEKKLMFPINVGRNIARDAATTHFILASDIELYPSVDFIPDFLDFQRRSGALLSDNKPKVFVLPPFEVTEGNLPPKTKQELVSGHCKLILQ